MACCPAHDDTTASLAITEARDGKPLVHCHAGCSQATVIAALQERRLWTHSRAGSDVGAGVQLKPPQGRLAATEKERIARALQPWCECCAASGTLVETYLRSRGITIPSPASVRYHANLKHRSGRILPAMVALVTSGSSNRPIGIHRTWLTPDGSGKAPISPNKMMLGPCRGGAVRLGASTSPLMIGEGIETCLAAMQATGHSAWAALSTSGLRALELPAAAHDIIVLADADPPGEAAAQAAATRWSAERRRVRIARPPPGTDFADVLIDPRVGSDEP